MTNRIENLILAVCGVPDHPLAAPLRRWCETSRPFLAFAEGHASKIRKKLRLAHPGDQQADLLAELAVAAWLLRDQRFVVVYEPLPPAGQRGPDFQVTFRLNSVVQVEVTRLGLPANDPVGAAARLARVLGDKIGQCLPGAANLLVVAVPSGVATGELVPLALRRLDQAAQGGADPPPEAVRAFQRGRQKLSGVLLCTFAPDGQPEATHLWLNPQARPPLLPEIGRYLVQRL